MTQVNGYINFLTIYLTAGMGHPFLGSLQVIRWTSLRKPRVTVVHEITLKQSGI